MLNSTLKNLLHFQLLDPDKLWLLLFLVLLVLSLAFLMVTKREFRTARSLVIRLVTFGLLTFALADPINRETSSTEQLIALVDISESMPEAGLQSLTERLKSFADIGNTLSLSIFPFAATAVTKPIIFDKNTEPHSIIASLKEQASRLDRGETNLGAALQFVGGVAPGAAVLLLSDGFETVGNAKEVARTLSSNGGRIYPLITNDDQFRASALELSMVQAPLTSKAGDLVEIRLTPRNNSESVQAGNVEVTVDDKSVLNQKVEIAPLEEKLITAKSAALDGGLHKIVVSLSPNSGVKQQVQRWVSVRKKSQLFLISGTTEDERILKQLLNLKGYSVQSVVASTPEVVPSSFEQCAGVILNNVANDQLPAGFLNKLKSFTQQGAGVVIVGGDRSYGLGGYINTALEEISPLKFIPPRTSKRRLIKAVALIIDKSHSMASNGKIEGARDATLLAIQSLQDEDYVTVIGFDRVAFVVIPVTKVSEVKNKAAYRLANLMATGGTDLLPALVEARRRLARVPADVKHAIILSDGDVLFSDQYLSEVARFRQEKITLSAVALGADANAPFLDMLRTQGNGRFHQSLSAASLPRIFIEDIKIASGEKTMREQNEFPVAIGPSGLLSTSVEGYPTLLGYIDTLAKKGANIELVTKGDREVAPLLASWKFGNGKVIAFTSDANGRWSRNWIGWEGFVRLWSQIVEEIEHSPDEDASQIDFDLRTSVNRKSIFLDLSIYDDRLRAGNAPKILLEATLPGGEKRVTSFLPERKGRFRASIDNARPGDYRFEIRYGEQKLPLIGATFEGVLFGEHPGRGINRENLAELASISSGAVNPDPSQVSRAVKTSEKIDHLFIFPVVAAFWLFLCEAFLRELGLRALFSRMKKGLLFRFTPIGEGNKLKPLK